MRVAVIPARGGSKRIPRKNVRPFCGKPMIAWSIEAARESGCFDSIVVSTDDAEIAATSRELGAEVPFVRPDELSDDHTGTMAVVAHAIHWLERHDRAPDQVCCVYATAPFLLPEDLRLGLMRLEQSGGDFAFSVTSFPFPIQRALRIDRDGRVGMFWPEQFRSRSQDLEEAFHDAGQFYWGSAEAWVSGRAIFGPGGVPVILPRYRVQDIDTLEDWEKAELMFRVLRSGGS